MKYSLICLMMMASNALWSQCEMPKIKVEKSLGSYLYDNHAVAKIEKHNRAYIKSFTFSMYGYPSYKFAFVLSDPDLKQDITIKVSELNKKKGTKTEVFNSKKSDDMEYLISDPKRTYVVDFVVKDQAKLGCVAVALGYKIRYKAEDKTSKKKTPRVKFK